MPHHARFEIDIVDALARQLVEAFDRLEGAPLDAPSISGLEPQQGVYQLFQDRRLVYVGKTDQLPRRLEEHRRKLSGRRNLALEWLRFKCLYVHPNWTALAPEASLIRHYAEADPEACSWNGSGFGPHDPGRRREETNKPPAGFDRRHPIDDGWVCDWVAAGDWNGRELLMSLKRGLPYLLRYQTRNPKRWQDGHPDYNEVRIHVPRGSMSARALLRCIASQLPGWQATVFPSHMILYRERRPYERGEVVWPE